MSVGDVADVGHIPEVFAVADDEGGFAFGDAGVDGGDQLRVSGAEDYGWAQCAGCEGFVVCGEHEGFGCGLFSVCLVCCISFRIGNGGSYVTNFGFPIDQRMRGSRPPLVDVRILVSHVICDCCAGSRPNESARAGGFGSGEHVAGTVHVDIGYVVFELPAVSESERWDDTGGMDDHIWADLVYYRVYSSWDCDIAHFVCYFGIQSEWQIQVQYCDCPLRMLIHERVDDEGS